VFRFARFREEAAPAAPSVSRLAHFARRANWGQGERRLGAKSGGWLDGPGAVLSRAISVSATFELGARASRVGAFIWRAEGEELELEEAHDD